MKIIKSRVHPMPSLRFTKEGLEKMQKDYEELLKKRPAAVDNLKRAREMGDLKENGFYKASRSALTAIDAQLTRYRFNLRRSVILEPQSADTAEIGKHITISEGSTKKQFDLVGDLEADPQQNKISLLSPLGRALEGRRVGETIFFQSPSGDKQLKIISIT